MIKSVFEVVKTYWGYFSTMLAVGSFIWALGVKSERKNIEGVNLKNDVVELKETVKQQSNKIDTLIIKVESLKKTQKEIIDAQNALRTSYTQYLANDKTLKLNDFLKYMDGLEFEIKPPVGTVKDDNPDVNIKITKKKQ